MAFRLNARYIRRWISRLFLLTIGIFLSTGMYVVVSSWRAPHNLALLPLVESTYSQKQTELVAGQRRISIVIPANNPSPDLCKLVMSAMALGYPTPVLVNWDKVFSKEAGGVWASHLGKITGSLEYMDEVTRSGTNDGDRLNDDDLILILDAYDVWLQLPPDVLLHRYHESIQYANQRLAEQWGSPEDLPMKQSIIISAQKRCYPTVHEGVQMYCDALPESSLPADIYGPKTDIEGHYYHNVRPRFINSGSFIGPIGDMRQYFRRVKERMDRKVAQNLPFEGDQGVFGEIFGEQEVWRRWRLSQHSSSGEVPNNEGVALSQREFEFHIGLDYSQGLFLPTVYGEDDGRFVTIGNQSEVATYSSKFGVSPVRLQKIPRDLADAPIPLNNVVSKGRQNATTWEELPLYADFFTTAIPAVLHHNAWKHGVKERRVKWWNLTWFFPFLREMMALRIEMGNEGPVAVLPAQNGKLIYYGPESDSKKRLPRVFEKHKVEAGLEEVEFEKLCRNPDQKVESEKHWWEEIFRDGKGPI